MDVDLEDDPAPLQWEVGQGRVHRGCRVVHEHLDGTAQLSDRGRHDPRAVFGVGEIGDDDCDLMPVSGTAGRGVAQAAGEMVVLFKGAGDDRDVGAFGGEPLRSRRADSTARAGHEHASAGEPLAARGLRRPHAFAAENTSDVTCRARYSSHIPSRSVSVQCAP